MLRRLVTLLVVGGILIAALAGLITGARIYGRAISLKQRLDHLQALSTSGNGLSSNMMTALRAEISGAHQDVQALQADAAPLLKLAGRLGGLPRIGPSLAPLPYLATMAVELLAGADDMLDGAAPLMDVLAGPGAATGAGQPALTERLLPLLIDAQPRLVQAQDHIERAVVARSQIDTIHLIQPLARQIGRLDAYLPALRAASQAAVAAPILLGGTRPMNYILLAQNNDELRATGGFISAIGVLTLSKGKITRLDIKDSYAVDNWQQDHPPAPAPLLEHMDAQLWVFRDANFWPDFPTSARAAEYFANLDLDMDPDGIIAIDQTAVQMLVGGLGSVVVPEYSNDVITGENAIAKIRSYWEPSGGEMTSEWEQQRKQFMPLLVAAMRRKLEADTTSISLPQLGKAILKILSEKHALIHLGSPLGNGFLRQANWDGAIAQTGGDYLFVVDQNMGWNKVNGILKQRIDYSVAIEPSGLVRGELTITYDNPARSQACVAESRWEPTYQQMMDRCYWGYLRVYAPGGATVIASDEDSLVDILPSEAGKTVLSRWLVVGGQERKATTFRYLLPQLALTETSDGWEYRLLVQKQAGTDGTPLTVTVALPEGKQIVGTAPSPATIDGNVVQFQTTLSTDREFRVLIR